MTAFRLGTVATLEDGTRWVCYDIRPLTLTPAQPVREYTFARIPDGETGDSMGRTWEPDQQPQRVITEPGSPLLAWQPIETAPKDDSAGRIIAWSPTLGLRVVYWDAYYAEGGRGFNPDRTAWVSDNEDDGPSISLWDAPTHWMLPDPPQGGTDA